MGNDPSAEVTESCWGGPSTRLTGLLCRGILPREVPVLGARGSHPRRRPGGPFLTPQGPDPPSMCGHPGQPPAPAAASGNPALWRAALGSLHLICFPRAAAASAAAMMKGEKRRREGGREGRKKIRHSLAISE